MLVVISERKKVNLLRCQRFNSQDITMTQKYVQVIILSLFFNLTTLTEKYVLVFADYGII